MKGQIRFLFFGICFVDSLALGDFVSSFMDKGFTLKGSTVRNTSST